MSNGACPMTKLAYLLVTVGGINWGLVGIGHFAGGNWNVVNLVLGQWATVEYIVYILVGVAAVWGAIKCCKCCDKN